jgi:hypothetical protein
MFVDMGTRLIQVVPFTNVVAGATVLLPHKININGVSRLPDFVITDAGGFNVAVTLTDVAVTNNSGALGNVNVWLELKHTIPRQLDGIANLTPQPFIALNGEGSGGPIVQVLSNSSGDVSPNATTVRFSTDTLEPLIYLASVAAGADGRQVTFVHTSGFLDAILLPDDLSEGVNGPPGATYTFPALDSFATFEADIAGNIWRKVGGSS